MAPMELLAVRGENPDPLGTLVRGLICQCHLLQMLFRCRCERRWLLLHASGQLALVRYPS